jgi:hypothetical protein
MRLFLLILWISPVLAFLPNPRLDILCGPDRFSLGPEVFFVERDRQILLKNEFLPHQIEQTGWMYGERFSYDRIRFNALYYGVDQYYAVGHVEGCLKGGIHPRVNLTDAEVEGRLGYTVGFSSPINAFFTPLVGFGYYAGKEVVKRYGRNLNLLIVASQQDLIDPLHFETLTITNRPRIYFYSLGFLTGVFLNECSSVGINFKAKIPTSAKNKVEFCYKKPHNYYDYYDYNSCDCKDACGCCKRRCDHSTGLCQEMGKVAMYQIDVPLTFYGYCIREEAFELSLIPFWRNRIYGYSKNVPFNFPETTYKMVGARFLVTYVF